MGRALRITILLPLVIMASFLLGVWGWAVKAEEFGLNAIDIALRALGSMVVATGYEAGNKIIFDWRLEAARMLGALAFVLAASQAIGRLLSRNASLWFGRLRRNHLLVIGDHPVARGLVEAAVERRRAITWISNTQVHPSPVSGALIVSRLWDRRLADAHAAAQARHIVVAFSDEVSQIAAVRDLRRAAATTPITMSFEDPWFGERMDELENISGVRYVSLTDLALRSLHWQHPPFLIAQKLGHQRLHVLLIGFGRAGEAVLDDLLLSARTSFQGVPRITIVDPDAADIEISLGQRCPELCQSVELVIIEAQHHADARILPWAELQSAQTQAPISLAYVCVDSDLRALTVAVSLQALVRREGWAIGPICTRLATSGALPDSVSAWDGSQPAGLLAFGATYDFVRAIGLFDAGPDQLARQVHEAYRKVAPGHAVANLPWEALTEEMRESNRRLMIHLPAKLASAGVDLSHRIGAGLPEGGFHIPDLRQKPVLLEQLAALEHERWMAERRLSGWQHGPERDNLRRRHPDLVPYDQLPEASKRFAREIVVATLAAVACVGDDHPGDGR